MSKQYTKEFKEDSVRYYLDHKDLGLEVCSKNLGMSRTALCTWVKEARSTAEKNPPEEQVITKAMKQRKMQNYAKI